MQMNLTLTLTLTLTLSLTLALTRIHGMDRTTQATGQHCMAVSMKVSMALTRIQQRIKITR